MSIRSCQQTMEASSTSPQRVRRQNFHLGCLQCHPRTAGNKHEFKSLRPMPPTPSASAGCKGAGCKAAGCKAAGLQAAGLQAAGLKAARVALQAAGLQAARLQAARVALQVAGWTWAVYAKGRKRCTVAFWDSKFATPLARQRLQRTKPRILSKKQRPKRAQVL